MQTQPPPYSVKEVSAEPVPQDFQVGVLSYFHILKNRKNILLGSIFLSLFVVFVINLTQKPVYRASAELLLQSVDPRADNQSGNSSFLEDPTMMLTQFRMVKTPHFAQGVLEKIEKPENREALLECFSIRPSRKKKDTGVFSEKERQLVLGGIQRALSAAQLQAGLRIITISATGYHPGTLAKLANAAGETYVEMTYKKNLDSFRQNFFMVSQTLAEIREKIKTGEFAFEKIDSEIKLLEALKIYGEKHPLVVQLRAELPQRAEKLKHEIQNLEISQIGQRKDLIPLLTTSSTTLEELQKIEADLYILRPILEQELHTNREMYSAFFRRLQEVEVSGGGTKIEAKLVEPAGVPGRPIRPNKKMNLILGFLVGILMGTGLAFFIEYLDSSLRSLDDVRFYLRLPSFGMVPHVDFSEGEENREAGESGIFEPPSRRFWNTSDTGLPLYVSEAYRIIRTNLSHGTAGDSLRVIQVTSAVKGEGKTTTVGNLGVSLAQAGIKTLLIDADLRRPSLHKVFKLNQERGLSEMLARGFSWREAVQTTKVENLFCIPSGEIPPNPSELLASKQMKTLLEELRDQFETIIVDSPPTVSVADATILASRVDGIILVSRSGFIPRHICLHAKNSLESVNGRIIGCILNSVQDRHHSYYYSRYYGYGYESDSPSGKEDGKKKRKGRDRAGDEGSPDWIQQLKVLREPFWVLLSSSWSGLIRLIRFPGANDKNARNDER